MRKYRLTRKGKLVFGTLVLLIGCIAAYRIGLLIGNGLSIHKKTDGNMLVSASIRDKAEENFNLKDFLKYMPAAKTYRGKSADNKNVEIFYVPHPDDELLSMGAAIAEGIKNGKQVHVVLASHGNDTNAIKVLNGEVWCPWHKRFHAPLREGYFKLTGLDIGRLRVLEFKESVKLLGVEAANVHVLNFDADRVTPYELKLIMLGFEKQYPGAEHNTVSYHDSHTFHQKLGDTLLQLYMGKAVSRARFFISPAQWDKVAGSYVKDKELRKAMENSENVYKRWKPTKEYLGIGYHSYEKLFTNRISMATSKFHNPNE